MLLLRERSAFVHGGGGEAARKSQNFSVHLSLSLLFLCRFFRVLYLRKGALHYQVGYLIKKNAMIAMHSRDGCFMRSDVGMQRRRRNQNGRRVARAAARRASSPPPPLPLVPLRRCAPQHAATTLCIGRTLHHGGAKL